MKKLTPAIFTLCLGISVLPTLAMAQTQDAGSVRFGEAALTFAAGSIQKSTPRDGIVNLITGDNQTTGNRMILGKHDSLYLKLDHPSDVSVGDLFTVYRRVRKVFHPVTHSYLGFTTIRLAVVKVSQVDKDLTTVEVIRSFNAINPGDLVMRFVPPAPTDDVIQTGHSEIAGMIVELQADKTMTMVSQYDVVYLDRGRGDGVKAGDLMDVYRHSAGLPSRKVGQLKVLSTEESTATARILKANTRLIRGDRYKLAGHSASIIQPAEEVAPQAAEATQPKDVVANKMKVRDAAGQSRINLGELSHFLRYDSGEAVIKPESYRILDQLIEYLHTSGDERLIRVEGHADNVEIGPTLKSRYPSNWELSKARASGVVRYLVEKGGFDSARLTSVGYGDSKPTASNAVEEGRSKNRRVEILLYAPQADSEATKQNQPSEALKENGDPSNLSAKKSPDQSAVPTEDAKAPASGTLSTSDPTQVSQDDGPRTVTVPDSNEMPAQNPVPQDSIPTGDVKK